MQSYISSPWYQALMLIAITRKRTGCWIHQGKAKRIVKEKDSQGKLHAVRFIKEKDTFLDSSRKRDSHGKGQAVGLIKEKDSQRKGQAVRFIKEKDSQGKPYAVGFIKEKDSHGKSHAVGFIKEKDSQGKSYAVGFIKEKDSQGKSHAVGFIKVKDSQGKSHAVRFINEEKGQSRKKTGWRAGPSRNRENDCRSPPQRHYHPRPLCPPPRQRMQTPSIALRHPSFLARAGCLKAMLGVCAIYAVSVTLKMYRLSHSPRTSVPR